MSVVTLLSKYDDTFQKAIFNNIGNGNPLGVPATSRILTGDSQKLSFSTMTKVPFRDFLVRQTLAYFHWAFFPSIYRV